MKIPKKLKIGGHVYKITHPYIFTERYDRGGDCSNITKELRIVGEQDEGEVRSESYISVVFLHEILHAIDHQSGLQQFIGDGGEERIEALSEGLFQVLRDNKLRFDEEK